MPEILPPLDQQNKQTHMQRHFSFVQIRKEQPRPTRQNQSSLGHTKLEFTYASFLFFPGSREGIHSIRTAAHETRRQASSAPRYLSRGRTGTLSEKYTGTTNKHFAEQRTHQSYNLSIGGMFFRVHVLRCMYAPPPPPPPPTWKTQMLSSDSSTNNAKPMKYII